MDFRPVGWRLRDRGRDRQPQPPPIRWIGFSGRSEVIDRCHATFAEVAFDQVAVGEGGREPARDLGHEEKLRFGWLARERR